MKAKESDKKCRVVMKVYHPPKVVVHGDVKKITLNAQGLGTGDSLYEQHSCTSPGNCG